jgi:hypothetical protein
MVSSTDVEIQSVTNIAFYSEFVVLVQFVVYEFCTDYFMQL